MWFPISPLVVSMPTSSKRRSTASPQVDTARVLRLRVELDRTEPMVWRRIDLRASATFWDLHVAIQDAFGWLGYHAHEFEVGPVTLGVPDEYSANDIVPGWSASLGSYLGKLRSFSYVYDFGDDWRHSIHLEEMCAADGGTYPRCLAGENAAPPEDCGGVHGFEEFKQVLEKPGTARYREMREWLKDGHARVYWPFDPLAFDPAQVVFQDPAERLEYLLA